jgi:lipoprotein-releasing system permease protein
MRASVNNQIAYTHLTSNGWQTVVAILGVTFGVSMYIFMNSFMNGVNKAQDDLAFSALAHIRIYNEDNVRTFNPLDNFYDSTKVLINIRNRKNIQYTTGIKNTSEIIKVLENQIEIVGITSQVNFSVFFRNGPKKINGTASGVEVASEDKLFGVAHKVISGNWKNLNDQKLGIVLGKILAQDLGGLKINDNVNILTPEGISKNYRIIGIIETSVKGIDQSKAYINIASARQLLGFNSDYSTDIQVNTKDKDRTGPLVKKLSPSIPYEVESWQMANQQLVAGSSLRNIIAIAVSLTILLVAGFGIYNIMNMTINQKIKEIAILKAMGFSGGDIKAIFLSQAVIIGFIGALVGVLLGYAISSLIGMVPFRIAGLSTLPIFYQLTDFIMAVLFGIITTLVAGYLPARKASKIDPVIIIRG